MTESMFDSYGIKQLGYYVASIEEAAEQLRTALGAGPFVDLGVSNNENVDIRGERVSLDMRTALGHVKDIQIELIEVVSEGPDPYHESGRYGLHHFCIYADDVDAAVKQMEDAGMTLAMRMTSGQGMEIAYLDARDLLGQYIEVTTPSEQLWQGIKAIHEKSPADAPALMPMSALMGSN